MINVRGLNKHFGNFQALKDVNLNVEKGDIYGFIGHNGAGKSTTISILTGLAKADSGTCIVNGKDACKTVNPSDLGIGYLPEDPSFYKWMTARETLIYLLESSGKKNNPVKINEILEWVGLEESAGRKVGGFSRGMKQRLGIGAALINDPQLLFLDEPSSALDPEGRGDVLRLIKDLRDMGKTVFFSTHILSDVERICNKVGILVNGRIVKEDRLEVIQEENILPIYDIETDIALKNNIVEDIEKLKCVKKVQTFDKRIQVLTESHECGKELYRFFSDKDLNVVSFNLRKNDLEDIFLEEVNKK
ncbi:MAG: ABC transporter ATP-binding protein [Clostridia bacterium]|nr:ABC transporter ATP-binding protein [Clostridia bacterium]MBN2882942.1 ABC transporter ATP-binding protein [Clostridia bacterium]